MKKNILFLVSISILIAFSSCTMEKRHYRNGWHFERNKNTEQFQDNENNSRISNFTNEKTVAPDSVVKTNSDSKESNAQAIEKVVAKQKQKSSGPIQEVISKIRKKTSRGFNDPNRMTYAQARKSIADKGGKPDQMAMTAYYMAWASAILVFLGIGILLLPITLIFCIFATNSAAGSGACATENLAIVAAAKRICFLALIYLLIAAVFTALLVLGILAIIGYYGGF